MKKLFFLLIAVLSISLCASAQTRTVKGTVVDATTDEPLVGVSVVPVGTTKGVLTDLDGNFSITINNSVKQLTFSYVGYQTVNVPVKDKMSVALNSSSETLETLVVTGYGSGKKIGNLVGAVSQVNSAAIANVTTPSFVDALQGQVAGLSVMSASGDPSSVENDIRMRGVNSLYLSNQPLFILDGAPVTQSVFTTLNPNDIESITILKDASSVAIYGSRAANGVIVITSKRGRYSEKPTVNFRAKAGFSQLTSDQVTMMNSEQYIRYRDLIGSPVSDEMRAAWEKYGINTNWRDEIFNSHAPTYSLEASVTGGTERSNYYLSVNHLDQEGIVTMSDMRRETVRVNLSTRATDWLRLGSQINLGYTKYQTNSESNSVYQSGGSIYITNPMVFARKALPMDSPRYWTVENGQIVYGDKAEYLHFSGMPTVDYVNSNRSLWRNKVTINANVFEEITPFNGLLLRAQQSVDAFDYRADSKYYAHRPLFTPMGDQYGVDDPDNPDAMITGSNGQTFQRYYQFTYTNTAEYRKRFADSHNITALLGQESIINDQTGFYASSTGQNDPRLPMLDNGTETSMSRLDQSSLYSRYVMNSYFLSLSYNYADKYFLEANIRRDGSSKFAPGHRWATFWSVGAMWDLKQENFLKQVTAVDDLRFRISYGTTGNSSVGNYAYFGLVGQGSNYNGESSLGVSTAPNYDFSWEVVKSFDVGVSGHFFNKLDADVDFYIKNTCDMILEVPYSYTTGVGGALGNIGGMRNSGVDVQLKYTPIQTKNWLWEIRANFNYNDNEITKLYNGLDELVLPNTGLAFRKGHPANEYYMVRSAGVDPRDGQLMWYTKEGNITKEYNEERDAVYIAGKTSYAPLSGGFGTTLMWKGLSLGCDFTWAAKKYMTNNDLYFIRNNAFATDFNQMTDMLNVWTTPGQITNIPAPGQELQFDTSLLENASFVRLKNLTLQYSLPKTVVERLGLTQLKFHLIGRNLLTFTGYTGYDPEPESNLVKFYYPNTRQFEFGVDVSF